MELHIESDSNDTYSSSFEDSDGDYVDEFDINKHNLANEVKSGFKRVNVENVDPVAQKLQSFQNSGVLPKQSMFYILLMNALGYVNWLVQRQETTACNFSGTLTSCNFLKAWSIMGEESLLTF